MGGIRIQSETPDTSRVAGAPGVVIGRDITFSLCFCRFFALYRQLSPQLLDSVGVCLESLAQFLWRNSARIRPSNPSPGRVRRCSLLQTVTTDLFFHHDSHRPRRTRLRSLKGSRTAPIGDTPLHSESPQYTDQGGSAHSDFTGSRQVGTCKVARGFCWPSKRLLISELN